MARGLERLRQVQHEIAQERTHIYLGIFRLLGSQFKLLPKQGAYSIKIKMEQIPNKIAYCRMTEYHWLSSVTSPTQML